MKSFQPRHLGFLLLAVGLLIAVALIAYMSDYQTARFVYLSGHLSALATVGARTWALVLAPVVLFALGGLLIRQTPSTGT